ncbi:MAG: outer membrane beta-barrel protein [Candidatus Tectomicrobia bacterium]|nr:outer membrane beta-barrel protein [Candidatus Tectomicrobia bacterium]
MNASPYLPDRSVTMRWCYVILFALVALAGAPGLSFADNHDVAARLKQLEATLQQMQATIQQQAAEIQRLQAQLPQPAPPAKAEPEKEALAPLKTSPGIELHGFVDGSFTASNREDVGDGNARSSFQIDSVELDIIKPVGNRAGFRVDLDYNRDAAGGFSVDVEQAIMSVKLGRGVMADFGKFNVPIGWELLDAPDLYQFSHSNVFNLGIPSLATGVRLLQQPVGWFDWQVYLVNGWDTNHDNNDTKTVGGRFGFTPRKWLNVGLSAITGAEQDDDTRNNRVVLDLDYTIKPTEKLLVGGEFNYGREEDEPFVLAAGRTADADWFGVLITVHYDLLSWLGFTWRFDYFNDEDGARVAAFGAPLLSDAGGQELKSFTFAPTFKITDNLGGLLEYRHDWSSRDTYLERGGLRARDNRDSVAVELTYKF